MRKNVRQWQLAICLLAALVFGSCGKNSTKQWFQKEYLAVQLSKDEAWSIIDKNGKVVVEEEYPADARISNIYDGVFWVKQGDTYQLYSLDNPKKPVTDEEFAHVTDFGAGLAAVANPNQQIRIVNTKGKTVATLPRTIKRCYEFSQWGYARFESTDKKQGTIDTKGNIVVKAEYGYIDIQKDMLLALKDQADKRKVLILDMKGKKTGELNLEKHRVHDICDGYIVAKSSDADDAHIAIFDNTGEKVFEVKKADGNKSASFLDGYLTFTNSDDKKGVADKNGEVIIRPKYENLRIIGNGKFFAKKGNKWGVVNAQDETILDFDYDYEYFVMGENYVMGEGSNYTLVNQDGKELESFENYSCGWTDSYVEFVDIENIANKLISSIGEYEKGMTAAQLAKSLSLSVDKYHYDTSIGTMADIDDNVTFTLTTRYNDYVTTEKTHLEEVNDGWFTYNRTVSDGWVWTSTTPRKVNGTIETNNSINAKDLYKILASKLSNGRKKVSDGTFSKNIKTGGKTVECRTSLSENYSGIEVEILFVE